MAGFTYKKKYIINESIGATKLGEAYFISDAETKAGMAAVEESSCCIKNVAKAFLDKSLIPADLFFKDDEGNKILEMKRSAAVLMQSFTAKYPDGKVLCSIEQAFSLIKPIIKVKNSDGELIGNIIGNWQKRHFVFTDNDDKEIAIIDHKITDYSKHVLTTADDYEVEVLQEDDKLALISVAATICIDFFYHE